MLLVIVLVALVVFAGLAYYLLSRLDIDPKVKLLFVLLFISLTSVILLIICLAGYLHTPALTVPKNSEHHIHFGHLLR